MTEPKQRATELVVWAYFKELKWWPAVIDPRELESAEMLTVRFLEVFTNVKVARSHILDFEDCFEKHFKKSNKLMINAVLSAERIISGESNYEVEMNRKIFEEYSQKRDRRVRGTFLNESPNFKTDVVALKSSHKQPLDKLKKKSFNQSFKVPLFSGSADNKHKRGRPKKPSQGEKGLFSFLQTEEPKLKATTSMALEKLKAVHDDELGDDYHTEMDASDHHTYAGPTKEAQNLFNQREVQSDFGGNLPPQNPREGLLIETASVQLRSEPENRTSLEDHLHTLAVGLKEINNNNAQDTKEFIYKETHRFVKNFLKVDLEPELILNNKVGRYLGTIYTLLSEINDHQSDTYSRLLLDTSNLVSKIKQQVISYYKSEKRPALPLSFKDSESVKLSCTPSVEEKINFLIKNYAKDEELETNSMVTLEEGFEEPKLKHTLSNSEDGSVLSDLGKISLPRLPLSVKREENQENICLDKLRRKVCRKAFTIFKDTYGMAIEDAKRVTLRLEEKVNSLHPSFSSTQKYIYIIKTLFNKLKKNEMDLKTVIGLSALPIDKFTSYVKEL